MHGRNRHLLCHPHGFHVCDLDRPNKSRDGADTCSPILHQNTKACVEIMSGPRTSERSLGETENGSTIVVEANALEPFDVEANREAAPGRVQKRWVKFKELPCEFVDVDSAVDPLTIQRH